MKKLIIAAGLFVALGLTEHTQAQVRVNVNLGIGAPVYYPAPRPVVVYDDPYPVCAPRAVIVVPTRRRYDYYDNWGRDDYYNKGRVVYYNRERNEHEGHNHGWGHRDEGDDD